MKKYIEEKYYGDSRYEKVWEQMQLLGIEDVSTKRQEKNDTIVWKLPIKNDNNGKTNIEVASMSTGYVRNQNSGYSNYQLNKRIFIDEYYPEYKTVDGAYKKTGKYKKYKLKSCKLIPIEIERLEYLISYCLKNYYIKHANLVPNGDYIPKWKLENAQNGMVPKWKYDEAMELGKQQDCGHYDRIRDLQLDLENMTEARDCYKDKLNTREEMNNDLECANNRLLDKLQSVIRTARH